MGKYFFYHMRKTMIRFVVMALFLCVLVNAGVCEERTLYSGETYYQVSLGAFAFFSIVAPFAVAGLEFAQFMNRRNLDTWYSLPISRIDLFVTHFLNGAIQMTATILAGAIVALIRIIQHPELHVEKLGTFVAIIWALTMFLYMVVTFFFVSANNVFDGCVFMAGSFFLPLSLYTIFRNFYIVAKLGKNIYSRGITSQFVVNGYGLYSIIFTAAERYSTLISGKSSSSMLYFSDDIPEFSIPQVLVWIMLSVGALAGAIYVFSSKKTEKVSGVSESWFGYRSLIPACTASTMSTTAMATAMLDGQFAGLLSMVGLIPTLIAVFVSYVIFRRGVKFKLTDIISAGALLVFYIICVIVYRALI